MFSERCTLKSSPSRSFPRQKRIYGREEFITKVIEQIYHKKTPLTLFGPPEIGKSAVASAVIHESNHDKRTFEYFGHRRHWADFGGITSLEKFLDILYGSLVLNTDEYTADFPIHTSLNSSKSQQLYALIGILHTNVLPRLLVLNDSREFGTDKEVQQSPSYKQC